MAMGKTMFGVLRTGQALKIVSPLKLLTAGGRAFLTAAIRIPVGHPSTKMVAFIITPCG
tara:strand:+ start:262204 stop:262380 length:177 start_codon:yes stop_codon:yes gene_type:complete